VTNSIIRHSSRSQSEDISGMNIQIHFSGLYRNSQQAATVYQNLLFRVHIKLNMFRATHRPSSGSQTALATSGFAYVKGCWTLRLLDAVSVQQTQRPTTFHVCKTRGC
jgi:hypothetical protein